MRPSNLTKAPTVTHCMCGPGTRWCARADAMFDVPGMHVIEVQVDDQQRLVLTGGSYWVEHGCPGGGGGGGVVWQELGGAPSRVVPRRRSPSSIRSRRLGQC